MATTRPDAEALNRWFAEHLQDHQEIARITRIGGGTGGRATFLAEAFERPDAVLSVHFAAADPSTPTPGTLLDGLAGTVELPFGLRPRMSPLTRTAGGDASDGAALIDRYALARLRDPSTLDRVYNLGAWAADQADGLLDKLGDSRLPAAASLRAGCGGQAVLRIRNLTASLAGHAGLPSEARLSVAAGSAPAPRVPTGLEEIAIRMR
jgi:hypothetical protein